MPKYVYYGHHKCASTWIVRIFENICAVLNVSSRVFNPDLHNVDQPGLRQILQNGRAVFLLNRGAESTHPDIIGPAKAFHVVRDPRDLIVSAYFSHLYSHPVGHPLFREQQKTLSRLDKRNGLLSEFDFSSPFLDQIFQWEYGRPDILELRMEDIIVAPYDGFIRICSHLGLLDPTNPDSIRRDVLLRATHAYHLRIASHLRPVTPDAPLWKRAGRLLDRSIGRLLYSDKISPNMLVRIVHAHRFEAKTGGRAVGQEDVHHHYRKGVAGDWRNHFEPVHIAEFKRRYNDGLLKLGYETDPDWQ